MAFREANLKPLVVEGIPGRKSHSGKLGIPIGWSVGMLTRSSTSPIEVVGYVIFPRGLALSHSTKKAFAAMEDAVR
jgi:hypothetical protein